MATYGTREVFQLKHRLVEYLVSEMGFTVFVIKAGWPESGAVNAYRCTLRTWMPGFPCRQLAGSKRISPRSIPPLLPRLRRICSVVRHSTSLVLSTRTDAEPERRLSPVSAWHLSRIVRPIDEQRHAVHNANRYNVRDRMLAGTYDCDLMILISRQWVTCGPIGPLTSSGCAQPTEC